MTSFLRLNGIIVPVAAGSATLNQDDLGGESRADDGTPLFNRRATKRKWAARTRLGTVAEALAFRDLVTGTGHVLSFEAENLYTSKGLAPSAVGADFGWTFGTGKFGTHFAISSSSSDNKATWPMFTASSPWTVAFWKSTDSGATWPHHYVVDSSARKWLDGVRADATVTDFLAVSSGAVTLGKTATALCFDDVVGFPNLMPTSWPAQIFGAGFAFGSLRTMNADGLFIEQNACIEVKGVAGEVKPTLVSGAILHEFSFTLLEN